MIGRRWFLKSSALLLAPRTWLRGAPTLQELRDQVDSLITKSGAEAVGVGFIDPTTGDELLIRPDEVFHAASTMKLPVLVEIFRQEKTGNLKLTDKLAVENRFASIVDGSSYKLDPKDDSELTLYDRIGREETIAELARLMIVRSSNLATNLLIARVSPEKTTASMKELGAPGVKVLRGVEDGKAFAQGKNNTVTARGLMTILRLIDERKAVSAQASDAMLAILKAQEFREGIPAKLPEGTVVAHKTGWITRHYHDAGIVIPKDRPGYVLAVLTRGIAEDRRAQTLVAEISLAVNRFVCRR